MNLFDDDRRARGVLAPLLGAALLSASLLVPLLDRTATIPDAALETEHHAATCLAGHDHTICTQVGANLPAPGSGHATGEDDGRDPLPANGADSDEPGRTPAGPHLPRAPPLV